MVDLSKFLETLDKVSDNCCEDNGKTYINFDKANDNIATADCLIIKDSYFLLVEFKKIDEVENIEEWMENKKRNQQILLKAYESYFLLKSLKVIKNFENMEKRFIFVYKSDSYKKKIKNHFKNKLDRVKIAYNSVLVLECKNFKNLLERL